jgi:hypothetical protein
MCKPKADSGSVDNMPAALIVFRKERRPKFSINISRALVAESARTDPATGSGMYQGCTACGVAADFQLITW